MNESGCKWREKTKGIPCGERTCKRFRRRVHVPPHLMGGVQPFADRICKDFCLVRYRIRTKTGKFGDFRHMGYKASWRVFWNGLTVAQRLAVRKMPFFDKDAFREITGIRL